MRIKIFILAVCGIAAASAFLWAVGIFEREKPPEKELEIKEAVEIPNFSTTTIGCIIDMTVSHEYADASIESCFEKIRKHMNCGDDSLPSSNYSIRIYPAGNFPTSEGIPPKILDFNAPITDPPRRWEDERKEYLKQVIAGHNVFDLLDEKCYIVKKIENENDWRKLNKLTTECEDKLKAHNEQVEKFEAGKPKIEAERQRKFSQFCQEIDNLGQNIGSWLRRQYPTISVWTYVRNAFIKAGEDLQEVENSNPNGQITLYVFIDYLEDHADIDKSFDWPDVSWKGIAIKEYSIPIRAKAKTPNTLFVKDEVVKWIKDHDGIVTHELLDFSPPQVSDKKDSKRKK